MFAVFCLVADPVRIGGYTSSYLISYIPSIFCPVVHNEGLISELFLNGSQIVLAKQFISFSWWIMVFLILIEISGGIFYSTPRRIKNKFPNGIRMNHVLKNSGTKFIYLFLISTFLFLFFYCNFGFTHLLAVSIIGTDGKSEIISKIEFLKNLFIIGGAMTFFIPFAIKILYAQALYKLIGYL
jgi:hypothetical protein